MVVSHDWDFLNAVCNSIIHLRRESPLYGGNFDHFESGSEQRWREVNRKAEVHEKQNNI